MGRGNGGDAVRAAVITNGLFCYCDYNEHKHLWEPHKCCDETMPCPEVEHLIFCCGCPV